MAIHCYGEEVQDVNIVNDQLEVNSSITGDVNVTGTINIGSAGGDRIPVDVSITNQSVQQTAEDDLVLKLAMQLYSYTNFEDVKNLTKHAKLCIERANYFAKAYLDFQYYKPKTDPNVSERLKEDGLVNVRKQTKD